MPRAAEVEKIREAVEAVEARVRSAEPNSDDYWNWYDVGRSLRVAHRLATNHLPWEEEL